MTDRSAPRHGTDGTRPTGRADAEVVLEASGLSKHFPVYEGFVESLLAPSDRVVRAVDGVDLQLRSNETLGLVGESGCGKSTLGRTLVRLEEPTEGRVRFRGTDITGMSDRELRPLRDGFQFIHQDPSSSLNPRKRVRQILARPLQLHTDLTRAERRDRVVELLESVGLGEPQLERFPHELSGGQRQRVEIARALSVNPDVVIADEPTSALDVTVQAQILELLEDLQASFDLSMVFISHDLRTVRYIADRVAVMYLGQIVELGPVETVFESPAHPYTQSLLTSVPTVEAGGQDRITLSGEPPDPIDPPSGCRFHPRCPVARDVCSEAAPVEHDRTPDHTHRCHFADADITADRASVRVDAGADARTSAGEEG